MTERKLVSVALIQHEKGGRPYLFQVPFGTQLGIGEMVAYNAESGSVTGTVLSQATMWKGGEEYNLALATAGQAEPLPRISYRIKRQKLYYESEE